MQTCHMLQIDKDDNIVQPVHSFSWLQIGRRFGEVVAPLTRTCSVSTAHILLV